MKLTDFNRRVKILGLRSRGLAAARAVLVDGAGLNVSADSVPIDRGVLSRLCTRIVRARFCPHCHRPMPKAA